MNQTYLWRSSILKRLPATIETVKNAHCWDNYWTSALILFFFASTCHKKQANSGKVSASAIVIEKHQKPLRKQVQKISEGIFMKSWQGNSMKLSVLLWILLRYECWDNPPLNKKIPVAMVWESKQNAPEKVDKVSPTRFTRWEHIPT